MFQMREHDKTPEDELNEVEITNQPNKELKVIIVNMLKELRRRLGKQSKKLKVINNELENIKKNQRKIKTTISEMLKYTRGNQ